MTPILCRPCTVYGPRCTDGAGKAFSRPTSITAIPGSGKQLLANVRAEDVARAVVHLSELSGNTGKIYNIVDDSKPTIERALTPGGPGLREKAAHASPAVVARQDRRQGRRLRVRPEGEGTRTSSTTRSQYLYHDYVVDNAALKKSGFTFLYPDFEKSMEEIARLYRDGKLEMR